MDNVERLGLGEDRLFVRALAISAVGISIPALIFGAPIMAILVSVAAGSILVSYLTMLWQAESTLCPVCRVRGLVGEDGVPYRCPKCGRTWKVRGFGRVE
jgi:predicted RNA-binding Zn-ribbon protein involved in translation (DUF1610 family)